MSINILLNTQCKNENMTNVRKILDPPPRIFRAKHGNSYADTKYITVVSIKCTPMKYIFTKESSIKNLTTNLGTIISEHLLLTQMVYTLVGRVAKTVQISSVSNFKFSAFLKIWLF